MTYTLVVLDANSAHTTNSRDVVECWEMFVRLIGFKEYYIIMRLD